MSAAASTSGGMSAPAGGQGVGGARQGLVARADAVALGVGARVTASTLLLACVLVIVVGASSMLDSLQKMDRDLKVMNEQLAVANQGTAVLNKTMDSLPPTSSHLGEIVTTVRGTSAQVAISKRSIGKLAATTDGLNGSLSTIATETGKMRASLEEVDASSTTLGSTVEDLNTKVGPLAATQHAMLGETRRMQGGLKGMNASLAYTLRTLNFMTSPPTGQGFTVRVEMDKKSLPPIPGVKAETAPVQVFRRGSWPVYAGP